MGFNPYEDIFNGLIGNAPRTPKPEKGVPWEAKVINGDYYVPLRQVAELLAANDALPAVRRGIEARVAAQNERKAMGL